MHKPLCVCLVLSACASYPSGLLLGAPLAVTSAKDPAIKVKLPGLAPASPSSVALAPYDRLAADLLAGAGLSAPPAQAPILAMSSGLEVLFVKLATLAQNEDLDGLPLPAARDVALLDVGDHGWAALGFRVEPSQLGGGPLCDAVSVASGDGTLARSVFCYALPLSTGEWVPGEDESVLAVKPEWLLMNAADDAIHALDMHIALHHSDLASFASFFTSRPLPKTHCVYFTLRPEFLTLQNANALEQAWGFAVDTHTIYITKWSAPTWGTPTVYRTWTQMGMTLTPGVDPPVIDGLAIDAATPGTSSPGDEILFSLAASQNYPSEAADQVLFSRGSDLPRRVVVRKRGSGYGSLGVQLGAGRGLGDFCTADPFGAEREPEVPLLDDFFVARRVAQTPGVAPASPVLALAVSGYRCLLNGEPHMRSCMSWPFPQASSGSVLVRWGTIRDCLEDPDAPDNLTWDGSQKLPYNGDPLVFDRKLPSQGWLLANSGPPRGGAARRAFVMQWLLDAGGQSYRSPIAALRY